MCVVSYVSEYYDIGPGKNVKWDRDTFDEFKQILKKLDELDAKTEQPDCVDPAKQAWMEKVEARLKLLEQGT